MEYNVNILSNEINEGINEYVIKHDAIYHLTQWLVVIKSVFNHDALCFYCTDKDNKICGVLPIVHINSYLFGNYMVSLPYFNYGGVLADNELIEQLLMHEVEAHAKKIQASYIEYRETKRRINRECNDDKVNMILKLPDNVDILEKNIGSKKRSQIRRPLKEGVVVEIGGLELIDAFYDVFAENMRDLGTPVYSKNFFREILTNLSQYSKLIILRFNGIPISTAFLLGMGNKLDIPWASTIRKYNSFSPNMLLYWEALKYAIDNNYKYFDFGRSSKESGTYKFKKQWGAEPLQLYWHYWLSDGVKIPKLTPSNPKYKLAIHFWKKLPIVLTKLIGPPIVKNLP